MTAICEFSEPVSKLLTFRFYAGSGRSTRPIYSSWAKTGKRTKKRAKSKRSLETEKHCLSNGNLREQKRNYYDRSYVFGCSSAHESSHILIYARRRIRTMAWPLNEWFPYHANTILSLTLSCKVADGDEQWELEFYFSSSNKNKSITQQKTLILKNRKRKSASFTFAKAIFLFITSFKFLNEFSFKIRHNLTKIQHLNFNHNIILKFLEFSSNLGFETLWVRKTGFTKVCVCSSCRSYTR